MFTLRLNIVDVHTRACVWSEFLSYELERKKLGVWSEFPSYDSMNSSGRNF